MTLTYARRSNSTGRALGRNLCQIASLEARRMMSSVTVGSGGTYATLQAALADTAGVPSGSTITVKPGTYSTGDLYLIDRSLTIRSQSGNPSDTILTAGSSAGGMQILADNVTLDGLTLSDTGGPGIGINDYRTSSHVISGVTLNNVKVIASPTDASGHGIYLGSVRNSTLSNVTVQATKASGVYLNAVTGTTLSGVTVTQASGASSSYAVVLTSGSAGNSLTSNTFGGGASQSIIVQDGSDDNVIRGNTISSPGGGVYVNGVTGTKIDGNSITLTGAADAITVNAGASTTAVTGNTITDAGSNGVLVSGSDGVVITGNTIANSTVSGIYLTASSNATITGNSITGSINVNGQNGITAIGGSNNNVISYNTVTKAYFDGIQISTNSMYNRVEGNIITSAGVDGVTVTNKSYYNFVQYNTVVFTSYAGRLNNGANGVGVWLDKNSDYNWVFQNTVDNASENGIAVFHSSHSYLEGNDTTDDTNGGIFITHYIDEPDTDNLPTSVPVGNIVTSQYSHGDEAFYLLARGAQDTQFTRNFTDGMNAANTVGVQVERGSQNTAALYNILYHMGSSGTAGAVAVAADGNGQTLLARDRIFARNSVYSLAGAGTTIAWDEGPVFGGNYWSDASGVTGDPSNGSTPYKNFIWDNIGGFNGPFADRYPFADESLGLSYTPSISEPAAGTTIAGGSIRTIRWTSAAAVFVDITLVPTAGGSAVTVASNAPNTGLYRWTVPDSVAAGDYAVRITPKNSAQVATGSPADGGVITVTAASGKTLRLTSPSRAVTTAAGSQFRVSWLSTGVASVNVQAQVDGGAWQTLASGVSGTFADVTLPSTVSGNARVRVVDTASTLSDTMDGSFSLTGGGGAFLAAPTGTVAVGSLQSLTWRSPTVAVRASLSYSSDGGTTFTSVFADLDDVGSYTWIVPDLNGPQTVLKLTFADANGTTISAGTATTAAFAIPGQGNPVTYVAGTDGGGGGGGGGTTPTVDFTGTASTGKLKASYISDGKTKISAKLTLKANNAAFSGTVPVSLLLIPAGSDPSTATPLATTNVAAKVTAGKTKVVSSSFAIPSGLDGTYDIAYRFNVDGTTVAEADKTNNVTNLLPIVFHKPAIDLAVAYKAPVPTAVVAGNKKPYAFAVTITNTGNVPAVGSTVVNLLRSADAAVSDDDAVLMSKAFKKISVAAGKSLTVKFSYKAPVGGAAGNDFVLANLANLTTTLTEGSLTNNFASTPVTFS